MLNDLSILLHHLLLLKPNPVCPQVLRAHCGQETQICGALQQVELMSKLAKSFGHLTIHCTIIFGLVPLIPGEGGVQGTTNLWQSREPKAKEKKAFYGVVGAKVVIDTVRLKACIITRKTGLLLSRGHIIILQGAKLFAYLLCKVKKGNYYVQRQALLCGALRGVRLLCKTSRGPCYYLGH